jgi:hypothetical protein
MAHSHVRSSVLASGQAGRRRPRTSGTAAEVLRALPRVLNMGKAYSEYSRAPQLRYSEHVRGTRTDSSTELSVSGSANGIEREREAAYACALGRARAVRARAGVWILRAQASCCAGSAPGAAPCASVLPCVCESVLGSPLAHICTRTRLAPAHICTGLGLTPRILERDCARTGNLPCWDSPFSPSPFPVQVFAHAHKHTYSFTNTQPQTPSHTDAQPELYTRPHTQTHEVAQCQQTLAQAHADTLRRARARARARASKHTRRARTHSQSGGTDLLGAANGRTLGRTPRRHAELQITASVERLFRPFHFCDSSALSLGSSARTIGYSGCLTSSGSEGHLFAGVWLIFAYVSRLGLPGLPGTGPPFDTSIIRPRSPRPLGAMMAGRLPEGATLGPAPHAPLSGSGQCEGHGPEGTHLRAQGRPGFHGPCGGTAAEPRVLACAATVAG